MGGAPRPCATCRVLWGGWRGDGGERACAIIARAIVPILRAAKEIEEENPRVAYLCMSLHASLAHFRCLDIVFNMFIVAFHTRSVCCIREGSHFGSKLKWAWSSAVQNIFAA
jgi:hypothetical protein